MVVVSILPHAEFLTPYKNFFRFWTKFNGATNVVFGFEPNLKMYLTCKVTVRFYFAIAESEMRFSK